jgi:hypothetical protein
LARLCGRESKPKSIAYANEDEVRVDGISGVYRFSEHTICVEMYANKIVAGTVQKVIVLRNVSLAKNPSTALSQDAEVEVK